MHQVCFPSYSSHSDNRDPIQNNDDSNGNEEKLKLLLINFKLYGTLDAVFSG